MLWDQFVDNPPTSGILVTSPTILGDESLGDLLTALLPPSDLAPVGDGTEVEAFLDAFGLFGPLG